MDGNVEWRLSASPTHITMAERRRFRLRVSATNHGSATARVGSPMCRFTVNGVESMEAEMAFGNGVLEPGWQALPPGKTVDTERELGDLFTAPGRYDIVLTHGPATSRLRITVVR